jgi:hypothetical protein
MRMKQPGASERRATRLIFLLCGMAHSSWALLVPYAKVRVHANNQHFGLLLFGASIGAIDVVLNVQASLVERHSGEIRFRNRELKMSLAEP